MPMHNLQMLQVKSELWLSYLQRYHLFSCPLRRYGHETDVYVTIMQIWISGFHHTV